MALLHSLLNDSPTKQWPNHIRSDLYIRILHPLLEAEIEDHQAPTRGGRWAS